MGEVEVKRATLKEKILREKGWYVPSLHGKGLDKATAEDKPKGGGDDMVGFDSFEIKGGKAIFYNEKGQTLWFDLIRSRDIKFMHSVGRRVHGK